MPSDVIIELSETALAALFDGETLGIVTPSGYIFLKVSKAIVEKHESNLALMLLQAKAATETLQ